MKTRRSLFDSNSDEPGKRPPLADRMRPCRLEELLGQDHLLGEGKVLRLAIEQDMYPAPAGSAKAIATRTREYFASIGLLPAER